MATNISNALSAYAKAAGAPAKEGAAARPTGGDDFSSLVRNALDSAVGAGKEGERMAEASVAGKANLTDVVTAVANAEVVLDTVVQVRDKVIQAYQEIIRMPI